MAYPVLKRNCYCLLVIQGLYNSLHSPDSDARLKARERMGGSNLKRISWEWNHGSHGKGRLLSDMILWFPNKSDNVSVAAKQVQANIHLDPLNSSAVEWKHHERTVPDLSIYLFPWNSLYLNTFRGEIESKNIEDLDHKLSDKCHFWVTVNGRQKKNRVVRRQEPELRFQVSGFSSKR